MDLSLRDALGGGGGGAPAEALLKRDFVASLEKESFDDKVGEKVSKSDYRPLLDGKDTKSGPGMMSSMMSSGRQDPPGQPAYSSDYLSGPMMGGMTGQWNLNKSKDSSVPDSFLGLSQSGIGGTMGAGLPPFQTSMSAALGQTGMSPAMDTQKSSGLFGGENLTPRNISGTSPLKGSDMFSPAGLGIHPMDQSAAPAHSPRGSMDDSSPSSSNSEPISPERLGPGGEAGKQRRRKKKRKDRNVIYNFFDNQENGVSQSDHQGMQDKGGKEVEEDGDEEENWEWEFRESGGGGRVKSRKTKSRARLPEEWGAPQQPVSPTPAAVAPKWAADAGPTDPRAPNPSGPQQIPTGFTNCSHASPLTDSSSRSYEPMCVDDYSLSGKGVQTAKDENASAKSKEPNLVTAAAKPEDANGSLALMTGDNLSPVSQTFSFLDAVLQTPPGSTPDSQTTTPISNTPSMVTASLTRSALAETTTPAFQSSPNPSKSTPNIPAPATLSTSASPSLPTVVGSALNVDAKPFVPSTMLMASTVAPAAFSAPTTNSSNPFSSTLSSRPANEPTSSSPLATSPKGAATSLSPATRSPSTTQATPSSLPAHSKHQESSSPQLPPLEVKSENKEKQEKMDVSNKTAKVDNLDKKEEQQKKDISNDKNQKSDQILKTEEKLEKHDRVSEKAEKVDKPEKTNKDEKKEDEKKPAEKKDEKGGKVPAKSPTGNGGKTLLNLDNKSKTPENGGPEKRPSVPKTTPTTRTAANKNGSSVTNKNAANKNDKTESRTGEAKKPKTTARPRPASTAAAATPAASTNGEATHRRRVITKPPVPKQTPLEKKPAGPRPPRTPRPINAPTPDLKNVRSKIGSIDNIKYQPGGGKVSSTPNNKTSESSTPTAKARVQILNRKVDVSKVTSKCGSKDNIKYKPGGGDVKIESHKSNIKAKSKIGSLDNMEAGNGQTNGHKEKTEEKTSPPASGAPATGPAGVTKATPPGGVAKENGMKEPIPSPFGGEGLKETHSLDKRITETK
uniref:Microtubule associated protein 4 like n=1 Tax=Oryzias latipes TaxID=8090 RepID=A0A3P9LT44_ORYLA